MKSKNSFNTLSTIDILGKVYQYFNINLADIEQNKLPYSLKVLLENALRFEDGKINHPQTVLGFKNWIENNGKSQVEVGFMPSRVLMQDFTGVPAIVDLAAMRDAVKSLGGDAARINPLIPVDLVIDHSLQVDKYANNSAFQENVDLEMQRNKERYEFLRWGAKAFNNFRVVPPGSGICHQVNLEYLAKVVKQEKDLLYFDTLVGTDSHTTMANALGVLGWGVGGIEAEAAMLGQPLAMLIPEVVGVKIQGNLGPAVNATDLVLNITQMLRKSGVVGKFVEFYGPGLAQLSLADRATIANMAPEYGATCGFFPIDDETIKYLKLTGRTQQEVAFVEDYAKAQGLWHDPLQQALYSQNLSFDLNLVKPSISGPKRPQDRMDLSQVKDNFLTTIAADTATQYSSANFTLHNASLVIAAITSCTNTSNPYVMIGAALVAKKISQLGGQIPAWVKTSFAPGSQVVVDYLNAAGLSAYLDQLGFNLVGYGCTTCIGNSGPLLPEIEELINTHKLQVAAVLSGNRNFEGRIHPLVKANYLASPMLVVAYALAGRVDIDIEHEELAKDKNGNSIFLKDIWPNPDEINNYINSFVKPEFFVQRYANIFQGSKSWKELNVEDTQTYLWKKSTYINNPPYFANMRSKLDEFRPIHKARILAVFGDSITTDHISPAGSISLKSPAASYLLAEGVNKDDFNSYGARRGNHEVMMRGTFANIRIQNELCPGVEGGFALSPTGEVKSIYQVAMEYKASNVPLVIFAGKEYGTGSSRDWAAKGPALLGVRAVIAESFERIHRSNLVGMGVLPLKFLAGLTRLDLNLTGKEIIDLEFSSQALAPRSVIKARIDGARAFDLELQVFTDIEVEYLLHGTVLHKVIRQALSY